jgi:hypothetical protein
MHTHLKNHGIKEKQTTLNNFVKSTHTKKKYAIIEWIILNKDPGHHIYNSHLSFSKFNQN